MNFPVLITGAHGMLGWDLTLAFKEKLPPGKLFVLGKEELDITQPAQLESFFSRVRPGLILNAAAYTQVDSAEKEPEKAHQINTEGPSLLAQQCKRLGAKLVHFSTDQVFDGTGNRPRTEVDTPCPLNTYAKTKWLGEVAALTAKNALVLRLQWLYGEKKDRFTPLRTLGVFRPFSDQFGAPTWTRQIARVTWELVEHGTCGLFHVAHDDYASWAEVYEFAKQELGVTTKLEPRLTAQAELAAPRPRFSVLSNAKLKATLGKSVMGSWKEPLRAFLRSRQGMPGSSCGSIDRTR